MSTTTLHQDFDLQPFNTFGVPCRAEFFAVIHSADELMSVVAQSPPDVPIRLLGGGSNVLLPAHLPGVTILNQQAGIQIFQETHDEVVIEVGGGMNWHHLVLWTLRQGYGGIENLALIPGTVGAAPIQNIGAYGVELQDVLDRVHAIELATGQERIFDNRACDFGYRKSYFKKKENAGKFYLSKILLRLKKRDYLLKTSYGAITSQLASWQISSPSPMDVAAAVIEIRRSKLPDWQQLGNAGSFFKNPVISPERWERLKNRHPNAPSYPAPHEQIKVPAGWLIDQCGWKGKKVGSVGCFEHQALVIVNHGGATGEDIHAFSKVVARSVYEEFGIQLEREVNWLGD